MRRDNRDQNEARPGCIARGRGSHRELGAGTVLIADRY